MKNFNTINIKFILLTTAVAVTYSSCSKSGKAPAPTKQTVTVSTFAGSGDVGLSNGSGITATFKSPSSVKIGSDGNLYVGDWLNNVIRKIDPASAAVTTFAGTGTPGFLNGDKSTALFNGTANIMFDKSGNLFVADEQNSSIREIKTDGTVITIAGDGTPGFQDGDASTAEFNLPEGMVMDTNGDIYVADNANNRIRKITMATGKVSTYAGTGAPGLNNGAIASATFHSPYGITMDAGGNIIVGDIANNVIRKINVSTGTVSTLAGTGTQGLTNGAATSATFYHPCGVVFDSKGNLFVSELGNFTIRKITTDGTVSTFAGTGKAGAVDGDASKATFNQPIGIVFDKNGDMYVADEFNNKIRKITITQSVDN
jgi:sugar lactone lactonase YvrE